MASTKGYLDYVLEQLRGLEDISWRPMMGEYVLYCQGKVVGGIYDDRFLLKPTASALKLVPQAVYALPYEGAKEMLV
ncbi:MAG: TfoX/Sxy family protein, partial [Erysipelotrichaceae bacterium]|nr:TfoX/Sxy family protein [Erysipelotrichaceae bacterium]